MITFFSHFETNCRNKLVAVATRGGVVDANLREWIDNKQFLYVSNI